MLEFKISLKKIERVSKPRGGHDDDSIFLRRRQRFPFVRTVGGRRVAGVRCGIKVFLFLCVSVLVSRVSYNPNCQNYP